MSELISVIVPVYNTGKFIEKCIRSLKYQTYQNLEIILVNDGSVDDSLTICQRFAEEDSRIIVIDQENQGVSAARNTGLKVSQGEWISLVDSDDYLSENYYEELLKNAKQHNVPIAVAGIVCETEEYQLTKYLSCSYLPQDKTCLNQEKIYIHFFNPQYRFLSWSSTDKLYRRDVLDGLLYEENRKYAEDYFFCFEALLKVTEIVYVPLAKYHYILREGSATHEPVFRESFFDVDYFNMKMIDILKDKHVDQEIIDLAQMHQAVCAARIVRNYYTSSEKERDFSEQISKLRTNLKKIKKTPAFKKLDIKYKILVLEASIMPICFRIR